MPRKPKTARLPATDSLSNLAASLGAGKDKAAQDAFFVADLPRDQIEAMYRGDWLARKIVDIVPYDSIRAWRAWSGERAAVAAVERAERRLGVRAAVQRAMTLGRLYGGAAIIVGTDEADAASLARPLLPETLAPDGVRFLHVVSRWQLGVEAVNADPLDPYYGEPASYTLAGADRGALVLHPSRVVRFLGNPLPDAGLYGARLWSDSVLQALYDAIHAVALTAAGATSLVHEAKVDVVTVPNLSEYLANATTTAQLSQRFSYAAAMKSINNLLLLGDGESWARQRIDFAGLPEMVRTFLQMAAGAADIPVTRLLGQSPAGLSATGDSDTRNYYDMIAARQELDLRPRLERLDALLMAAAGVDAGALSFAFRPLWQLSAAERAGVALQKAQATQLYAGLGLWPASVTAALVQGQLLEDGTYPGAAAAFGEGMPDEYGPAKTGPQWAQSKIADYSPEQPRDDHGRWMVGGGGTPPGPASGTAATAEDPGTGSSDIVTRILSLLNPIGSAEASEVIPKAPVIRAAHIGHDPINEETPEDDEEKKEEEEVKEQSDLLRGGFRVRPDGSMSSATPPMPGGGLARQPEGTLPILIKVTGASPTQRGYSYEQGIRDAFGTKRSQSTHVPGVGTPDDVLNNYAIEAKYVETFASSPYNPDSKLGFNQKVMADMIDQARRYASGFKEGVRYYTNSPELAVAYERHFRQNGISNFRFIVVPASR